MLSTWVVSQNVINVGGLAKCYQRGWSRKMLSMWVVLQNVINVGGLVKMLSTWVVPTPIFAPTPKSQITPPIFLDPPNRILITPNRVPTHSSQFPSSPPYPKDHLNIVCPNLPKPAQSCPRSPEDCLCHVPHLKKCSGLPCLVPRL